MARNTTEAPDNAALAKAYNRGLALEKAGDLDGAEAAFRQELMLCVILIPLAFWVGSTAVERALLIASCLLVLITELLNSSIEAVVDRIGAERNELSGKAKDIGSAAVFISLWTAGIVWALIGYERLMNLGV